MKKIISYFLLVFRISGIEFLFYWSTFLIIYFKKYQKIRSKIFKIINNFNLLLLLLLLNIIISKFDTKSLLQTSIKNIYFFFWLLLLIIQKIVLDNNKFFIH